MLVIGERDSRQQPPLAFERRRRVNHERRALQNSAPVADKLRRALIAATTSSASHNARLQVETRQPTERSICDFNRSQPPPPPLPLLSRCRSPKAPSVCSHWSRCCNFSRAARRDACQPSTSAFARARARRLINSVCLQAAECKASLRVARERLVAMSRRAAAHEQDRRSQIVAGLTSRLPPVFQPHETAAAAKSTSTTPATTTPKTECDCGR